MRQYVRVKSGSVTGVRPLSPAFDALSRGGAERIARLFIETPQPIAPGSGVTIDLTAPDRSGVFTATGLVEWSSGSPESSGPAGIAVGILEIRTGETTPAAGSDPATGAASAGRTADDETAAKPASEGGASAYPLPGIKALSETLENLLGVKVAVEQEETSGLDPDSGLVIASYVTDSGSPAVVAAFNLDIAAKIGAALALIPVEAAMTGAEPGRLPKNVMENFREVLNVASGLFNRAGSPHLAISAVYLPADAPPAAVNAIVLTPAKSRYFAIDIPNYGKGSLAVMTAAIH